MWEDHVLYIDGEAIVIDKPAGLAVHPGPRTPRSLEDHLRYLRFGFHREPAPVHRLDRDTSGCLLLARHAKAHKRFQRAFEEGAVRKTYAAVIDGEPEGEEGLMDLALTKVSSREAGWRMVGDLGGKPSRTRWRVVHRHEGRALVRFEPETGRTHQVRVHAAEGLGAAVVGDPVYGRGSAVPLLLHAVALEVGRESKPPVVATAPLPERFGAWRAHWPTNDED